MAIYNAAGDDIAFVQWGERLIYKNEAVTNSEGAIKYLVQREMDKTEGYVTAKSTVFVARLQRSAPEFRYRLQYSLDGLFGTKLTVQPPMLVYVLEIKEDGWAKIKPYNAEAIYQLRDDYTRSLGIKWIPIEKVSTNSDDVEVVIAIQQVLGNVRQISPTEEEKFRQNVETQIKFLQDDVSRSYRDALALVFVTETIDKLNSMIGINNEEIITDESGFFDEAGGDNDAKQDAGDYSNPILDENL